MSEIFLEYYEIFSVLIAVMDCVLAVKAFLKRTPAGKLLGAACAGAAIVDISYLVSILSSSYLCMSIMSSIYFLCIDFMLVCLLGFTVYFTRGRFTKAGRIFLLFCCLYTLFECIVFSINPFCEIAVHYQPRATVIAQFSYQMRPLYYLHLAFTYLMVAVVVGLLVLKLCRIPLEYRSQYQFVILGILIIVSVNAVFLFWPEESIYSLLDYSICGYSLTAFLLYWSCFDYSTHGMLNSLKTSIFDSIGQGIVLFDYEDHLILHNKRADELLGGMPKNPPPMLEHFLRRYDLPALSAEEGDSISVQCYIKNGSSERPLRCDIRALKNKKGQLLGQLFVFSDAALETDLLTGFQNWESFQVFVHTNQDIFPAPTAVAVCDINSLSVINSTLGNQAGNQKIQSLADTMRECFPKQTYYVRGLDANLIALCGHGTEAGMQACMRQVRERFRGKIQFAVTVTSEDAPDVFQAVQAASAAMRAKKLLDRESIHSEMISSLVRALQECDSDTEHHVRRTQKLGAELGRRIELSDVQQSRLSLLCLLHDIGKIGIPLEILNKPGALSSEERMILQTHTQKGYDIANSNNELKCIADEILHHHERWDGKGYPDGLSRESIPLLSRVIAVVDAYDAMTNNRSYRHALSPADAIAELKRGAGTQFDPFIVSEFLTALKENPPAQADDTAAPAVGGAGANLSPLSQNDSDRVEDTHHVHPIPYSRYILNEAMRIVYADENFEKMTGYTQKEIQETVLCQADLLPEEERIEYLCHTNACLAKSPQVYQEHKLRRKDGTDIYVFCFGRLYYDSAVRAERSEIIIVDIAKTYSVKMMADEEANKAQIRLKQWESTYRKDSLTGLLTHAAFRSDVELKLLEGKHKIMMLMLDVDKFKDYNDTYGHHNGDKFLILVAQSLNAALRKDDCACRMGGDEFAVALFLEYDVTDSAIYGRAQQIFDKVSLTLKSADGKTGISMGVAIAQPDTTFNQLYELSDKALYRAKENGRGRMVIHTDP